VALVGGSDLARLEDRPGKSGDAGRHATFRNQSARAGAPASLRSQSRGGACRSRLRARESPWGNYGLGQTHAPSRAVWAQVKNTPTARNDILGYQQLASRSAKGGCAVDKGLPAGSAVGHGDQRTRSGVPVDCPRIAWGSNKAVRCGGRGRQAWPGDCREDGASGRI
jgi:hypothetical protein